MIPKEARVTLPIKFRPITLLEVHGKIFEKILNDRLTSYLERENILPKHQYGFRRNLGTQTAIITAYEKIAINQKDKHQVNVIGRDVQKAFDKVWHNGLKFKILNLNLPPVFEKTLCNYLDNRTTTIKFEGQTTSSIDIRSGVPQGSILGPILYLLYTSDLPPTDPNCTNIMYADNVTQIIEHHHPSKRFLALRTEREITKINDFEKKMED